MGLRLKLLPMVVAALLSVVMAASAWAHSVPHKHGMTKSEKIAFYHEVVRHDRQQIRKANTVFRFFEHHTRLLASADTKSVAWQEVEKWRAIKREHSAQMKFAERRLRILTYVPGPAHLALWRCIAGYPGARPGGGPGESKGWTGASNGSHFNILQMTNPWGSEKIDPIGMSADAIMWAAEREGARHGFASWWLNQQWGQTIGPCWGYV